MYIYIYIYEYIMYIYIYHYINMHALYVYTALLIADIFRIYVCIYIYIHNM